jgi:hypothetical protein
MSTRIYHVVMNGEEIIHYLGDLETACRRADEHQLARPDADVLVVAQGGPDSMPLQREVIRYRRDERGKWAPEKAR